MQLRKFNSISLIGEDDKQIGRTLFLNVYITQHYKGKSVYRENHPYISTMTYSFIRHYSSDYAKARNLDWLAVIVR